MNGAFFTSLRDSPGFSTAYTVFRQSKLLCGMVNLVTVYEANRREIKLALMAQSRAEAALIRARVRLRTALKKAVEEDQASLSDIANVFIDAGRPVSRQRIDQILKGDYDNTENDSKNTS